MWEIVNWFSFEIEHKGSISVQCWLICVFVLVQEPAANKMSYRMFCSHSGASIVMWDVTEEYEKFKNTTCMVGFVKTKMAI